MNPEIEIPKPNMANTPEQMEDLIQKALGRLTIYRMEAQFVPEPSQPSNVERFVRDVMAGKL